MEIVIKISDEDYKAIAKGYLPFGAIADAIRNGISLPEHHGRLIDYGCVVDAIDDWINTGEYSYTNATDYLRNRVKSAPTIIEADKGGVNMPDVELVIKIPENIFKKIEQYNVYPYEVDVICEAILSGTPLSNRHGRLKDIDAFITKVKADRKHSAYLKSWTADDVLNALDNNYAPTIIEGSGNE